MDLHDSHAFTRRQFLHTGLTLASAAVAIPAFLQSSAFGMARPRHALSSHPGVPEDHVLVVVQLGGGNDGLNTVVPFGQDAYYRARPGIGVRADDTLPVWPDIGLGLHPGLEDLKALYDEGLCAVVQGVGYPNPNRSHFKSMDIWQTADTSGTGDGWLGRYFDSECCGFGKGESGRVEGDGESAGCDGPEPPVSIGRRAPRALRGRRVQPVAFESAEQFSWMGERAHPALSDLHDSLMKRPAGGDHDDEQHTASFLMRTALDARVSSEMLTRASSMQPLVRYPRSGLGRQLAMVSSMIRSGLPTRVYYTSLGGFDTHAGQGGAQGRHARLLREFSSAVRAFYADLRAHGNDGRVLTMSFSEFGRRVGQNASGGTDHGTAAPMFLCGPMVRAGLHGDHPSLDPNDLESGDVRYGIDFRSVYAGVLEGWMKADSRRILNGRFTPSRVIAGM